MTFLSTKGRYAGIGSIRATLCLVALAAAMGCAPMSNPGAQVEGGTVAGLDSEEPVALAGSRWQLVRFQSMDDAIGVVEPADRTLYTMALNQDGSVHMRLNCNRANGSWSHEVSPDGRSGKFRFGPLAMTRGIVSTAQHGRAHRARLRCGAQLPH